MRCCDEKRVSLFVCGKCKALGNSNEQRGSTSLNSGGDRPGCRRAVASRPAGKRWPFQKSSKKFRRGDTRPRGGSAKMRPDCAGGLLTEFNAAAVFPRLRFAPRNRTTHLMKNPSQWIALIFVISIFHAVPDAFSRPSNAAKPTKKISSHEELIAKEKEVWEAFKRKDSKARRVYTGAGVRAQQDCLSPYRHRHIWNGYRGIYAIFMVFSRP